MDTHIQTIRVEYWRWFFLEEPITYDRYDEGIDEVLQAAFPGFFGHAARLWVYECKEQQRSVGDTRGSADMALLLSSSPSLRRKVLGLARRAFYGGQRALGMPLDPHHFNLAFKRAKQQALDLDSVMHLHEKSLSSDPLMPRRKRL